jgi:hypothetical protein
VSPAEVKAPQPERGKAALEEHCSKMLFRACAAGSLLGIVATIYFLFGLAGYVHHPALNLFSAAAVAAAWIFLLTSLFFIARNAGRLGRALAAVILAVIGLEILLSVVPPTARDELTHHLAIPLLYARAGRVIEVPIAPYSYYPMLLDMLYTPWIYWGHDFVPKMIHGLFGFLTGLILYAYLSRRMNAVYGLLGFLLFISVPAIARLSHWAYIDLGVTFFSTACLTALVRWRENKAETRWLVLAALAAGFAAATKPNGLVVGLMATFILAFVLAEQRERAVAKTAAPLLIFAVVGALPVMPWLVKNWLQTGNPLFPFLTGLFPAGAGGPGVATEGFAGLGILAKRGLLYGESWWQIAALPLRLFFTGRDDDPQHFDGVLSPVLILLLPWAFKGKWLAEKKIFLSFAALYLVYALFLVDLRVRYILPIVPPLVILAVYGVFNIYAGIRRPAFLFAGLLLIAVLHGSYLWRTYQEVAPLGFLAGRERREDYLTRVLPGYTVFRYANRELPPAAKIYLLFMGRRAYYLERGYFHDGGELPAALLGAIRSARDPAQIEKALEERGITHLMVREDLLRRFLADNLRPAEREVWDAFVGRHLRAQFRDYGYGVYQLHG